jgi:hypothetical protein
MTNTSRSRSRSRSAAGRGAPRAVRASHAVLGLAEKHIGEAYVLGARTPMADAGWHGPWDCAEFATWCVYQATRVLYGARPSDPIHADAYSGWWAAQARADGADVDVALAARTPGALLVRAPATGRIGHVAISDGLGGTVEAHSSKKGVCREVIDGRRWSMGVLVPGVTYFANDAPVEVTPPPVELLRVTQPLTRGPRVRAVQRRLRESGCHPGPDDGVYGPQTADAARAFQAARGLVADGEVGPATAQALGLD